MIKTLKWIKYEKDFYGTEDENDLLFINEKIEIFVHIIKDETTNDMFQITIAAVAETFTGPGNFLKIDYAKNLKDAKKLALYYLNGLGAYKK